MSAKALQLPGVKCRGLHQAETVRLSEHCTDSDQTVLLVFSSVMRHSFETGAAWNA